MAWQRIYAFLLRRVLGPYLAPSSAKKLHRCIEISLTEGRFVLTDVELDPARLNALLSQVGGGENDGEKEASPSGGLRVRRAVVRRLGIHLSLREGDDLDDGDEKSGSSMDSDPSEALTVGMAMSTVSKAYRLSYRTASDVGTSSGGGGVSLMANIEIDGLEIDLAPMKRTTEQEVQPKRVQQKANIDAASPSSGGGYISSYVDAALASLRLTLRISDASIRAFDRRGVNFVALRMGKALYKDGSPSKEDCVDDATPEQTAGEAVLRKVVEFDDLSIEVGPIQTNEDNLDTEKTIARTDGSGRIRIRAIAFHEDSRQGMLVDPKPPRIQREIDATFCERLSFSLSATSLLCLSSVLRDARYDASITQSETVGEETVEDDMFGAAVTTASTAPDNTLFPLESDQFSSGPGFSNDDDTAEAQHISEIMRQYSEARHLARTREVRGGMLLPSFSFNESGEGSGAGDGAVAFDIFFDANEQSFHHYRTMVSDAGGLQSKTLGSVDGNDENDDGFVHTRVAFRLPDCSLKCLFESNLPQMECPGEHCFRCESAVSIMDCNLSMSLSDSGSDATFSASHFQIDDTVLNARSGAVESGYLLRFLDPSELYQDAENDESGDTYIVSSAPCLSVDIVSRCQGASSSDIGETEFNVVLDPMELTYRQETVSRLSKLLQCMSMDRENLSADTTTRAASNPHAIDNESSSPFLRVKATCPALTVFCPIPPPSSGADLVSIGSRFHPLFDRTGYRSTSTDAAPISTPGIGLTFDEVSIGLSTKTIFEADNTSDIDTLASPLDATNATTAAKEMTLDFSCQNAIMFGYMPPCGSYDFTTRADLIAFQGESNIDSAALVKVQFKSVRPMQGTNQNEMQKMNRNNNTFPLVPPLSAVKATQPQEESRADDACSPSRSSSHRRHRGKRQHQHVRAADPQYAMSAEAAESNDNIDVSVPSIAFDLTTREKVAFIDMITAVQARPKSEFDEVPESDREQESWPKKKDPLCLSLNCKRLSVTLHGSEEDFVGAPEISDVLGGGSTHVSYIIIADKMRFHALLAAAGGLRNIRICSHDITLYEAIDLLSETPALSNPGSRRSQGDFHRPDSSPGTTYERCRRVWRRGTRQESTREARPILFRQKLYRPLSPETSAFILDVLNRSWGTEADAEDDIIGTSSDIERSVYFSLYDVTYRCDIESHWRQRLVTLVQSSAADEGVHISSDHQQCLDSSSVQEEQSILTNLFVTLSDCTLDYTSPLHFTTVSRSLLRFGEIRLTGNVISPPAGPTQTYKLSIADFEHHLCNHHVSSRAEDSRLSCSGSVLQHSVGSKKFANAPIAASIEDAARRMGFVTVATLDSADAIIALLHEDDSAEVSSGAGAAVNRKPGTTLTLSFGRFCLYTCRDSFVCFNDTLSEWITELTTPSEEDVIRLKDLPSPVENENDDGMLGNSIFPDNGETNKISSSDTLDTNSLSAPHGTSRDLADIPDSELSAAELRKKHGLAENGISQGLSNSFFSEGFGDFAGNSGKSRIEGEASSSPLNASKQRTFGRSVEPECQLGGHGWTTVDHEWSQRSDIPPGQEQSAKWLTDGGRSNSSQSNRASPSAQHSSARSSARKRIQIVQHHVPKDSGSLFGSGASSSNGFSPDIKLRVVVHELGVNFRFFDGYDWMDSPMASDGLAEANTKAIKQQIHEELLHDESPDKLSMLQRRAELIGELLDGCDYQDAMFRDDKTVYMVTPKAVSRHNLGNQRKARQTGRFFSLAASGVKLQYDSFVDAVDHRLSSRMDLSMDDLFIAETISDERKPVKMLGEWFNEKEHPRDSNDGLLMMKMVSMHPVQRISDDGKYVNDESRVSIELLPLRFFLHQKAIRFTRKFFTRDETEAEGSVVEQEKSTVEVTPTFFQRFKVFPTKLKVDYQPERCDTAALKDGSYVELINLLPLEDMVLTLQPIELINITGWGSAFSEVTRCWLSDICATQMHKFITNTSPFHPILNVGGGVAEMFMIPIEEMKGGGSFFRGLREGTAALAGTVAYEALNTTSKASKYAANALSGASSVAKATSKAPVVALPSRPSETPSKVGQVARHAVDSLSRGLEEANYKIIIVPCREYSRSGTTGAVKSVIRGIPVAVRAPLSGASEAVSYATLLARNAINPDKRKEEEATLKGLSSE